MAEVFQGTPVITTVGIWDQEGKKVEYSVCGRDIETVKEAVRKALEDMSDQDQHPKPISKPKRHRRTKAEIVAARGKIVASGAADDGIERTDTIPGKKEKVWP